MTLHLVPKREASPAEKVRSRIKALPKPDGMLQCPECGGRSVCTVEVGVVVTKGRRKRGTIDVENVCDLCRQTRNRLVTMRTGDEKPIGLK